MRGQAGRAKEVSHEDAKNTKIEISPFGRDDNIPSVLAIRATYPAELSGA
jgi:hypothetical protein